MVFLRLYSERTYPKLQDRIIVSLTEKHSVVHSVESVWRLQPRHLNHSAETPEMLSQHINKRPRRRPCRQRCYPGPLSATMSQVLADMRHRKRDSQSGERTSHANSGTQMKVKTSLCRWDVLRPSLSSRHVCRRSHQYVSFTSQLPLMSPPFTDHNDCCTSEQIESIRSPEILSTILQFAVGPDGVKKLLPFTRVSAQWRRAALVDSSLWTTIYLKQMTPQLLNMTLSHADN